MANNSETYVVTLRAVGSGPPAIQRLRAALKCLLRSFGLKCVAIAEDKPASTPESEPADDGC